MSDIVELKEKTKLTKQIFRIQIASCLGRLLVEGYQPHLYIKHDFAVFSFSLIGEKKIVVFELLPQIVVTLCEIRPLKILGADQRDAYCRNLANETSNSR